MNNTAHTASTAAAADTIGRKTLNLNDLIELGLTVPKFEAIPANTVVKIAKSQEELEAAAKNIADRFDDCEFFAVRSSALIEDSDKESLAGQFKTRIAVPKTELNKAISEVIAHADKFLKGKLEKFSIMIQEYIEPDVAGVTFTRNPSGGREMIIEWHKGRGESLVSGKIKPEKAQLYWTTKKGLPSLPGFAESIEAFKKIEKFYRRPQDIEWCIKDKKWYFLQTRPITTLTKTDYEQSLYLDETLPKNTPFLYEKTEISEIAPRPTQITLDLLEKVYEIGGPIAKVYNKHKIKYEPKKILKIIGNELFVDREEERKSLSPKGFFGLFRTLKNAFHLYRIRLDNYEELFEDLKEAITGANRHLTIQESLETFLKNYELVFEINLKTGIAIKKLENFTKKEKIPLSSLLSFGDFDEFQNLKLNIKTDTFKGNTIEIADETPFVRNECEKGKKPEDVTGWWNNLSPFKKKLFSKPIQNAAIYNRLREMSRWLVVKNISDLRRLLLSLNKKDVYFATFEELTNSAADTIKEDVCKKRASRHASFMKFTMPKILSGTFPKQTQKNIGISPGIAEGTLLTEEHLNNPAHKNSREPSKILLTKILSPELTKYFDQIKGIVSEQGGMLSHLAIIAREQKLPIVVISGSLTDFKTKEGDKVEINGGSGEIKNFKNHRST